MKMKKAALMLAAAGLMAASVATMAAAAEQKWTCNRYYHGEYAGYMTVWASSHDEAVSKAIEFYKDYTYDYIKCE